VIWLKGVWQSGKLAQGALAVGSAIKKGMTIGGNALVSAGQASAQFIANFGRMAAQGAVAAWKFAVNLVMMGKQAIITGITALPGLISSVWAFTAALLANPITWVVVGIVALGAAIILLI